MSKKRILITGNAGFIGSNLVRKIGFDKLPYEMHSVDKLTDKNAIYNMYNQHFHKFNLADICDADIMDKIFAHVKPEIVLHLAAEASVDRSIQSPTVFAETNVVGTQILANLSIKHKVSKFIYHSTDECYGALGEFDKPWTEESPINPRNPYSATKAAGEFIVRAAANTHGLPFVILRTCNNYGPRQTSDKLIPRIIKSIFNKEAIPVHGKGNQIREWIHVLDNCNAIIKIMDKGLVGETYNVSSREEHTNIEVINMICDIVGAGHDLIKFGPDRPGQDFRYSVDNSKLLATGWSKIYKFEDGLKNTIDWYSDNKFFL